MTVRVGIDPGLDGGLVAIGLDHRVWWAEVMPVMKVGRRREINRVLLREIFERLEPTRDHVLLEDVSCRPVEGRASILKTGRGHGLIEGILVALRIPHTIERPLRWQKAVGIVTGKGHDTKGQAIAICGREFPGLDLTPGRKRVPHTGLADAGCMALRSLQLRPILG